MNKLISSKKIKNLKRKNRKQKKLYTLTKVPILKPWLFLAEADPRFRCLDESKNIIFDEIENYENETHEVFEKYNCRCYAGGI